VTWSAVIAALDDGGAFHSTVSIYQHPLAGRPILWHVVSALSDVTPPPSVVRVVHRASDALLLPEEGPVSVLAQPVAGTDLMRPLRAALTSPGPKVLVDGAAALLTPPTIARLLRVGEGGLAALEPDGTHSAFLAIGGEGPALASADDPRHPIGALRIAATSSDELIRITDRHSYSEAALAMHDRLIRYHEAHGVTFLLPATTWIDAEVQIGPDTIIYPGAVIEGRTDIGGECVIGPHCRIVESNIGRGAELKGWNYVSRTAIRQRAVLEPHVRRGFD